MSIFDSKSLRGLIIAVILYITSLNALYIPEEIQGWTYTSIQPTGSSPFYYNFTYNNIIGPPRSFMAGLVGIRSSSTGSIDIQVNATLLSTKMMVTITKGATWLLDQVDFSYMMTNDVGITVVRNYNLRSHPNWALFTSGSGYRALTYNVSYIPSDSSLFQSNMTASISLTGITCSVSTGDFYIDLKIGLIGKDWVTFTAQTAGANLFSLLIVDILIFSQAFRDAHQLIHTPLNLTHTENTIYTTSSFRSAFTFSPIPGENNFYRTRPIYLHLWQGFTLSRTTPNLMIFPYFSEDYLQNYGYLILYFEYKTPIKTFAYEFISICQFGVDCTQSSQQDIDFERLTLFYGGLPTICNVYPHTTWDSQIVNYAFKSTLLKRPKYFIAGYYPWDWELKSGSAGSTLENYSNRSYTLKLYSGPNTILDWSLVYYMYSEWDGLQLKSVNLAAHSSFVATFGTATALTSRSLTYAIPYNPCPELQGTLYARIIFTRHFCSNTPASFGVNSTFLSSNGTHAFMSVTILGACVVTVLEGNFIIYSPETPGFSIESHKIFSGATTTSINRYPSNYQYALVLASYSLSTTVRSNIALLPYLSQTNQVVNSQWFYSSDIIIVEYLFMLFLPKRLDLIMEGVGSNFIPNSSLPIILSASYMNSIYGLFVTDADTIFNQTSYILESSPDQILRIFHASIFTKNSNNSGNSYFGPIDLPLPLNLTFRVLVLNQSSFWIIRCYLTLFLNDITSPDPDEYLINYFDFQRSPLKNSQYNYRTVQAITLLSHNASVKSWCSVQLTFNGILRGFYLNEEFILAGGSKNSNLSIILVSPEKVLLTPNSMFYVTAVGYKLFINQIGFINCMTTSNLTTFIQANQYLISSATITKTIDYNFTTTTFAPFCLISKNSSYCLKCHPDYVNYNKFCISNCPFASPYIANQNYCVNKIASQALRSSQIPYYSQTTGYNDNFELDVNLSNFIIINLYFTNNPSVYKFSYLTLPYANPSLAESSTSYYFIGTTLTTPVSQILMPVKTFLNLNIFSYLMTSIGIPDAFLVSRYNTSLGSVLASEEYYSIMDTNIDLGYDSYVQIDFVLDSMNGCNLSFYYKTQKIQILRNHRSTLFYDGTLQNGISNYKLSRPFNGTNFITIILTSPSVFNFSLEGNCTVLAPGEIVFQDSLNVSNPNSCSLSNCYNCLNPSKCLSCLNNSYLEPTTNQCVQSCNLVALAFPLERLCVCQSLNCQYSLSLQVLNSTYCEGISISSVLSPSVPILSYNWTVLNVTGGNSVVTLSGTVASSGNLIILNSLLYPGVSYNVSLFIVTYDNASISSSILTSIPIPFLVSLIPGKSIIPYNLDDFIEFNLTRTCNLQNISGHTNVTIPSEMAFFNFSASPLRYTIKACSFNFSYSNIISANFKYLNYNFPILFRIATSPENFIGKIINGDTTIPYTYPLNLSIFYMIIQSCPQDIAAAFSFSWTCNRLSDSNPCLFPIGTNQNRQNLVIPGNTYTIGTQVKFFVQIYHMNSIYSLSSVVTFEGQKTLVVSFDCSQNITQICFFTNQQGSMYITGLIQNQTLNTLNYIWTVSSDPAITFSSYLNQIKINLLQSPVSDSFQINLTAWNSTHSGFASLNLRLSMPPSYGDFIVDPLSGFALQTIFYLNAPSWYQMDLPLTYSFSYLVESQWRYLVKNQNVTWLNTMLPYWVNTANQLPLKSEVFTVFQSKNESLKTVTLFLNESSLSDNFQYIYSQYVQTSDLNLLQILSTSVRSLSSLGTINLDADKTKIINYLQSYNLKENLSSKTEFYNILSDISLNTSNLSISAASSIYNIVYQYKDINYSSYAQASSVSNIMSNLFQYITASDCTMSSSLGQKLNNQSTDILQRVVESLQSGMITNENASIITTKSFDIYASKVTDCKLVNSLLFTSNLAPTVRMKYTNISEQCQNQTVFFSYYAVNDNLFSCQPNGTDTKSRLTFHMTVEGGNLESKNLLKQFYAEVSMPNGVPCILGCQKINTDLCKCTNLNLFDFSGQLLSLFKNSNLKYVNNADAILTWKFYQDPVFWVLLVIILCALLSDLVIKFKYEPICWIKEFKESAQNNKKANFGTLFWTNHILVSIYIIQIPKLSKRTRSLVYYCRMIAMVAFAAIFKTKENNLSGMLINPYLLALPYITFIPIYSVLEKMLTKSKKKALYTDKRGNTFKHFLSGAILILATGGWVGLMMIIAANQGMDEKIVWIIQFGQILVQDLIISPFITLFLQGFVYKLTRNSLIRQSRKVYGILRSFFEYPFLELIVKRNAYLKRKINFQRGKK